MTSHLFGAVSSMGCANVGLKGIADDYEHMYGKDAADFIRDCFYVYVLRSKYLSLIVSAQFNPSQQLRSGHMYLERKILLIWLLVAVYRLFFHKQSGFKVLRSCTERVLSITFLCITLYLRMTKMCAKP